MDLTHKIYSTCVDDEHIATHKQTSHTLKQQVGDSFILVYVLHSDCMGQPFIWVQPAMPDAKQEAKGWLQLYAAFKKNLNHSL